MRVTRLKVTAAVAAVTLAALSGCGSSKKNDDAKPGPSGADGGSSQPASTQVEVFSWWTAGGEAEGLDAMVADFAKNEPNIKFVNAAVAGGAGTNAKAVLASRLEAKNPPDSFQGHAGAELSDYIKAGQIEDLTFLYKDQGWDTIFPSSLMPLLTVDGKIYSVPVNIHRANVLWYNPAVLKAAGIDKPATSVADFIADLEKVKKAGKIPISVGGQWTQQQLMETILLADLGADAYNGLWTGSTDWSSSQVTKALDDFKAVLSYATVEGDDWQDASTLVANGDAAFNVMGDWADGLFQQLKKSPNTDYGWAAVPGTGGVYQFLSDSFTLPVNAPHRDAAIAWLKEAGSKSGQDAFNPLKGSIPARADADKSLYGPYLQWALDQWKSDKIVGSLTHGVVANGAWSTEIGTAFGLFLTNKDVGKLQSGLATAAANAQK